MYRKIVFTAILLNTVLSVQSLTEKLFAGYDNQIRPNQNGQPVEVAVNILVSSFANIEETSMEYKVFMYFRQYWKDERLAGKVNKAITLKGSAVAKIWTPDPFCHNGRESNLGEPDEEIRSLLFLDPDGNITYSRLAAITAECLMDLRHFPADVQKCSLSFGSYSYSTEDIIYKWKEVDAVTVNMKTLPQFLLINITTNSEIQPFSLGNFSTISVDFTFQRRTGYFLMQMYAPDIFIVILSWIVFWMDARDIGNRMALGITAILTIMFLMGSVNESMPKVSYPKALDWYLIISFVFLFFSLVECMMVYKLSDTPIDRSMAKESDLEYDLDANDPKKFVGYWIDFVSRILFPLMFLAYNVYYWIIFLA